MKKYGLFFLLVLLGINKSISQKRELGNVTIEELNEKFHPKDSSAVAAVIFKKGDVSYAFTDEEGFTMITVVKTKIKVYKKEGYDFANNEIEYYIGGTTKESVSIDDALTYNLVNGKIEKTKLKKESEFDENINKYWSNKKITMPNVKVGSIIEFQYTIRSKRFQGLREWYFQSLIPVNYAELTTRIPEFYVYKSNQKGFIFPKIISEKKMKKVHLTGMQRNDDRGMVVGQRSNYVEDDFEYEELKTNYIVQDLPAMKEESYVNNINNYMSCVSHELNYVAYPNKPLKTYSTNWESVTKTIFDEGDFSLELNKTGYFDNDVNVVISGLTSPNEKIAAIFNLVKSKVKWNKNYGIYCNNGVKKAYLDNVGNVAEVNLILTSMLRYAGLTANPVLVSTRSNGIAYFPSIAAFNYVICAIELPDGLVLLDATNQYAMPNVLPDRDLNWKGRMIRNDGTSMDVNLMPSLSSRELANVSYQLKSDGTITGKIKKQYSDYLGLSFRNKYNLLKEEMYLEEVETQKNIDITDYARENQEELSKSIGESFSFIDTKHSEIIANKIYFSPLVFLALTENPFKQEVREYPIDFSYPTSRKYNIIIDLPDGYVVESMPAPLNIAIVENIGSFKYLISNTGSKIQVSVTFDINKAIVGSEYYEILKAFFKQLIEKQNEKIIITKN
ncbi:DUF3857 domain-containing protein [Flavobacterium sp.]|uniref:DUF3857 domain-containing protein n=1 Tax=Flavobacterium sp. TaxID=239 RepID=UPI003750E943